MTAARTTSAAAAGIAAVIVAVVLTGCAGTPAAKSPVTGTPHAAAATTGAAVTAAPEVSGGTGTTPVPAAGREPGGGTVPDSGAGERPGSGTGGGSGTGAGPAGGQGGVPPASAPAVTSLRVVTQPTCPVRATPDAPFSAPGTDVTIAWTVTGAKGAAIAVDNPGIYGAYGSSYPASGQLQLSFPCDPAGTTTHTYTVWPAGAKGVGRTLTVSARGH